MIFFDSNPSIIVCAVDHSLALRKFIVKPNFLCKYVLTCWEVYC